MSLVFDNSINQDEKENDDLQNSINIKHEKRRPNDEMRTVLDELGLIEEQFQLPIKDVYRLAVRCYREQEKTYLTISYEDRLKLMAYSKQAVHGKYVPENGENDPGWFDFIGNDRTQAWEQLGDLSKEGAMAGFISLLDKICPPFKEFVSANRPSVSSEQFELEQEDGKLKDQKPEQRQQQSTQVDFERFEAQRRQIQEALNQQTYHQFRAYAEQQFAGNPDQQEALIKQLQEQHYQQYMAQVYAQQSQVGGGGGDRDQVDESREQSTTEVGIHSRPVTTEEGDQRPPEDTDSEEGSEEAAEDLPSNPAISPASMWTRKDTVDFKNAIRKENNEGLIKIGHGETVTVRVPTHEEGRCLFWEFTTDNYDIGFGVYFEWSVAESNQVSVHVSESSDEDDELNEEAKGAGDVETAADERNKTGDPNKPQLDEIIPVYRRDCHEEVYAGSHAYPGQGVYLLKFDNSYSLWRSKTLYYRVYYSK